MKKTILFVCLALSSTYLFAQLRLSSESGLAFNGYNDVRAPNTETAQSSLFSFVEGFTPQEPIAFLRLQTSYTFKNKHTLELTAQPVRFNYERTAGEAISFENTLFDANNGLVEGRYEFDTYRFSYRYAFARKDKFRFELGLTALLRDARIALTQGDLTAENTDLGFVPLLSFLLEAELSERLDFILAGDALVGPVGRAEDVFAGLEYAIIPDRFFLKAGYRLVEGGADVGQVYNFALFHIANIGIASEF